MIPKRIGLIGLGCVGQGFHDLSREIGADDYAITSIAVKQRNKTRHVEASLLSFDARELIRQGHIDCLVEAIDDPEEAWNLVSESLRRGIPVVTANKKMVAHRLEDLLGLVHSTGTPLRYEAAVCGAIPVIRSIDGYFAHEPIQSIRGIFNGTSNYILSRIFHDDLNYGEALRIAQELGFAESDPTSDVGAFDPKYKLIILALHAFGATLRPEQVFNLGIDALRPDDFRFARSRNLRIRVVPHLERTPKGLAAFVLPQFVEADDRLFGVDLENNAVEIDPGYSGHHFLSGKGAGAFPTAAAVLSDVRDILNGTTYRYPKRHSPLSLAPPDEVFAEVYVRYGDPAIRSALGFSTVREGALDGEFRYLIGEVSLEQLMHCRPMLQDDKASVIYTGRLRAGIQTNTARRFRTALA